LERHIIDWMRANTLQRLGSTASNLCVG